MNKYEHSIKIDFRNHTNALLVQQCLNKKNLTFVPPPNTATNVLRIDIPLPSACSFKKGKIKKVYILKNDHS